MTGSQAPPDSVFSHWHQAAPSLVPPSSLLTTDCLHSRRRWRCRLPCLLGPCRAARHGPWCMSGQRSMTVKGGTASGTKQARVGSRTVYTGNMWSTSSQLDSTEYVDSGTGCVAICPLCCLDPRLLHKHTSQPHGSRLSEIAIFSLSGPPKFSAVAGHRHFIFNPEFQRGGGFAPPAPSAS